MTTQERIAMMLGVDRATVARWLAKYDDGDAANVVSRPDAQSKHTGGA